MSTCSVGLAPRERLKLRRQTAAAAGKKSTTSLSLVHGSIRPRSGGRTFHLGRSLDGKMVSRTKRKRG